MTRFDEEFSRFNTSSVKWDEMTKEEKENGMLPFWIADSDYKTEKSITDALINRASHEAYAYTFPSDDYFKSIIKWGQDTKGVKIKREWIVPFTGVVSAIYFSISLFTKKKDNVTISTPVYKPFYQVVKGNKRGLLCNKLKETNDSYCIDFDDLEEKLKISKMFILCNPHNPVGRCYTYEELARIVQICKKYNVVIVSDEIHGDIIMKGNKYTSLINFFNEYNKIIVCTAPSKTFNIAGIQSANIVIKNKSLREKFVDFTHTASISTPNLFALTACEAAYKNGRKWMEEQNEYLTETRDYVTKFFKEFIPEAKVYKLEATYLMWINLSFLKLNQEDLIEGLKKAGVWVNSGTMYGEECVGYIRLNIACSRKQVEEGLAKIKKFIESQK